MVIADSSKVRDEVPLMKPIAIATPARPCTTGLFMWGGRVAYPRGSEPAWGVVRGKHLGALRLANACSHPYVASLGVG